MEKKRRAYEWSILYYLGGKNISRNADPEFSDNLKGLSVNALDDMLKSSTFTEARLNSVDREDYDGDVYGDLEIKIWRLVNDEWDFDYATISNDGIIQKSHWYNWKVPKRYQVELNKYIKGVK